MFLPDFPATVKEGQLVIPSTPALKEVLYQLKEGEAVRIKILRQKKIRSLRQNSYYWGVVLPYISRDTGHSIEELHEVFKRMFLPRQIVMFNGKEYPLPGSTAKLTSQDFTEFLERVRALAGEMGITIPSPT